MNLKTAIKRFNSFYKTKRKVAAAPGQWGGHPESGNSAEDLRRKAAEAGVTVKQYLKALKKRGKKGSSSSSDRHPLPGKHGPGSGRYYRGGSSGGSKQKNSLGKYGPGTGNYWKGG